MAIVRWIVPSALFAVSTTLFAAEALPTCREDPGSGLLTPATVPGICLSTREGSWSLVQSSGRGLLVLTLQGEPPLAAGTPEGSSVLLLEDSAAHAIFCPLAPGWPDATCVSGRGSLEAGPAALSGEVRIDAALRLGPSGEVRPPSTLLAWGSVRPHTGEDQDLRASLVLFADPWVGVRAREGLELDGSSSSRETDLEEGLRRIGRLTAGEWEIVQHLVQLDDGSWNTVLSLLEVGSAGTEPLIAPASTADELTSGDDPWTGGIVLPQGIFDVLRDIVNRVNGVRGVVNNVQDVLGPARPDIRGLVGGIDLARLRDLMDEVRDVLQGAIAIARELRAGFENFDVTAFRSNLKGLLGDLGTAWLNVQKLGCFEKQDLVLREWNFPLAGRLIDVAPPVVLFAMSRLLEQIEPDWRISVSSLNAGVPPSLLEGICTPPAAGAAPTGRLESGSRVCNALQPSGVEPALKATKFLSKVLSTRFEIMSEWAKDSDVVGMGAVVVGGATIVKKVEYPSKPAYKQISIMLDRLSSAAETLLDARKDCLDDAREDQALEDEIEGMVRECRPSHTVFLAGTESAPSPTLDEVIVTVQVFIDRIRAGGFGPEADRAQAAWDRHLDQATLRGKFDTMCRAYAELLPAPPGAGTIRPGPRAGSSKRRDSRYQER